MRQWSEEQRSGTMEMLLTLPVSPIQLVLGKFLAVMVLVALSLALTLFLPVTVAILGNLDWGPVAGGYIAALLLAAAYAAIGLLVSSRTDNQIVALISTLLIGGLLYLAGTSAVTDFVGGGLASFLRGVGSGSRFESIQRGVVDLRDLSYYLALAGVFLALNVLSLDGKRWSKGRPARPHRQGMLLTTALVVGETYSPPGLWSGTPLHMHDKDDPDAGQSDHEEIYYHLAKHPEGRWGPYGVQFLFDDAGLDKAYVIHHRDAVAIPGAAHPVVAGPVSDMLYVWALAGTGPTVLMADVPEFVYLKAVADLLERWEEERPRKAVQSAGLSAAQADVLRMHLRERGISVE